MSNILLSPRHLLCPFSTYFSTSCYIWIYKLKMGWGGICSCPLSVTITFLVMINSLFSFPYFSLPCIPYYKAEKLSLSLRDIFFDENEANQQKDINEKENLEEHWKTAKEIICRIKQFEREGKEVSFIHFTELWQIL